MGNSTNRSLQVKYKRSLVQKQASAEAEFSKPAYQSNKPALRKLAASSYLVPKYCTITPSPVTQPKMVMYNPSIHRAPKPLAMRCAVACDGELVKRADYLGR